MRPLLFFITMLFTFPVNASLKIAVASNFKVTLEEIVSLYEQQYPHQSQQKILISSASTGTLYNQINHGAPFDLFLSADKERAELIEQSDLGIKGSRFTYAQGTLAFWEPQSEGIIDKQYLLGFSGRIAIANPKLAPYGLAAKQALQSLKIWSKLSYIQGANITQAYQFVDTGNISAGIVAHSLLLQNNETNYFLLPADSYKPILQQGVMLNSSENKALLQHFVKYLQSDEIVTLIRSKGYL